MTSMPVELAPDFEHLIHERLDAVERVLLHSGMPRSERQTAVAEVESQIYEMLLQRSPGQVERQDVLAVLKQIDPPEAYLSHRGNYVVSTNPSARLLQSTPPQPAVVAPVTAALTAPQVSVLGLCSAAAGLLGSVGLIGVIFGYSMNSEEIMLLSGMMALLMGILATIGGVVSMFRINASGGREFGLSAAVFATLFLPLALMDLAQLFVLLLFQELGFYLSIGVNILLLNGIIIYAAWRFIASRMALKHKLAAG